MGAYFAAAAFSDKPRPPFGTTAARLSRCDRHNMREIHFRDIPWSDVKEHFLGALKHAEQMWEKEMRGMPIQIGPLDWKTTNLLGVPQYVILTEKFCFLTACDVCAEIPDSFGSASE